MTRFRDFLADAMRRAHPPAHWAAKHFSGRAALTALCFLFLATAGVRQMEAAFRKAVVKQGHYSLVATEERSWLAPDLRVGWNEKGAYVGFPEYAVIEVLAFAGSSLAVLAFLTPVAWFALGLLREKGIDDAPDQEDETSPADEDVWKLSPPPAE